jgi:hypothetical protein
MAATASTTTPTTFQPKVMDSRMNPCRTSTAWSSDARQLYGPLPKLPVPVRRFSGADRARCFRIVNRTTEVI